MANVQESEFGGDDSNEIEVAQGHRRVASNLSNISPPIITCIGTCCSQKNLQPDMPSYRKMNDEDEFLPNGRNVSVPLAPNHPLGPNGQPVWRSGTDNLENHPNFFNKKDEIADEYSFGISDMLYYDPPPGSFQIGSSFRINNHPTGVRVSDHFVVTIIADGLANRRASLYYPADITAQGKIRKNRKHFGHGAFYVGLPILIDGVIYHGERYGYAPRDPYREMHYKFADHGPGKFCGRESLPRSEDPVAVQIYAQAPTKGYGALLSHQIHQEYVDILVSWITNHPNRSIITEDYLYKTFTALSDDVIHDAVVFLRAEKSIRRQHSTLPFADSSASICSEISEQALQPERNNATSLQYELSNAAPLSVPGVPRLRQNDQIRAIKDQNDNTQTSQPREQVLKLLNLATDRVSHGPDSDLYRQIIAHMRNVQTSEEAITYGFKYLTHAASNLTYSHLRMSQVVQKVAQNLQFESEMTMNRKRIDDITISLDTLTSLNPNALPQEVARLKGLVSQFGSNIGVMDASIVSIREDLVDEAEFALQRVRASLKVIRRVHQEVEQQAPFTSTDAPSLPFDPSAILDMVLPERELSKLDRVLMPGSQTSKRAEPSVAPTSLAAEVTQQGPQRQVESSFQDPTPIVFRQPSQPLRPDLRQNEPQYSLPTLGVSESNQTWSKRRRFGNLLPPPQNPLPCRAATSRAPASYNETQLQRANRRN